MAPTKLYKLDYTQLARRVQDTFGFGHYGAPRGHRTHSGIDFSVEPNEIILSPVSGVITKVGYPYKDDLSYRYVEIRSPEQDVEVLHRLFYVNCTLIGHEAGNAVVKDEPIGVVQNLDRRYKGITNHVHYEIKVNGKYIDPDTYKGIS